MSQPIIATGALRSAKHASSVAGEKAHPTVYAIASVPLEHHTTRWIAFEGLSDDRQDHVAIQFGNGKSQRPLVRLHSSCITSDVFGSERCDCGAQLREAMDVLARTGGYLLYLQQEGRGIGLREKIRSYALQDDEGVDTFEANRRLGHAADGRNYMVAAEMLAAVGLQKISLLTNNPDKVLQLRAGGLDVERVPTGTHLTSSNSKYLCAKKSLGGHLLDIRFNTATGKMS